jgi:hypothetical protein
MKRKMKEIRCGPDELLTKGRTEASLVRRQAKMDRRRYSFAPCMRPGDAHICRDADAYPRDIHCCCMHDGHLHRRLYVGRGAWKLPEPRENVGTWECSIARTRSRYHTTEASEATWRKIYLTHLGRLAAQSLQSDYSPCLSLSIGNSHRYCSIIALLSYGLHKPLKSFLNPSIHACSILLGRIVAKRGLHLLFMPGDVHAETKLFPQDLLQRATIPEVNPLSDSRAFLLVHAFTLDRPVEALRAGDWR